MKLIKRIKIENFRSIEEAIIDDVGALNVIVGKNSSGKSNILKAFNLFFNGVVELNKSVSISRDYFVRTTPSKKKKRISVTVDFTLPDNFKFRQGLENLKGLGKELSITRTWELDERRNPVDTFSVFSCEKYINNPSDIARQFLGLISYRYIPNRTIPADILRDESQAIADSIFMRMKGDHHASALLSSLSAASDRMLGNADSAMKSAGTPMTAPRIALPLSIGEMLTMSGFQATTPTGGDVQDEDWGAGHQAFFFYLVLHVLDTNYGRFFGWRQATIWGIEEPESALHRELETRLAENIRLWSDDESSRQQIFLTTHSPIMTMAAERGFWTEIKEGQTKIDPMQIPELTRAAEIRGVSGWVHPVLSFPWNPVVLVEGPMDANVLSHVANVAGTEHLRFLSLPGLDPLENTGGKDRIINYLRKNRKLIQNRPQKAPLLVLFDWDVSSQELKKAKDAYGSGAHKYVIGMDHKLSNPLLGPDFKGIERFYPIEVILQAHEDSDLVLGIPKKQNKAYSISKAELHRAKYNLKERVVQINSKDQLTSLIQVILSLENIVRADTPFQLALPEVSDQSGS